MLSVVADDKARAELALELDGLVREGARRMLAAALEAEVDAYLAASAELTDGRRHRLVVRNGHAPARTITTAAGRVEVVRPRVDDRRVDPATGQRQQFQSVILPCWCRRSPKVAEVLPLLYLHGLSSLDFVPALERFFGAAAGLSASVVTRLTQQWQVERVAFLRRDLHDQDYVTAGPMGSTSTCGWRKAGCVCWCWWGCVPMAGGAGRGGRRAARVDRRVG
jgi:putative transposase